MKKYNLFSLLILLLLFLLGNNKIIKNDNLNNNENQAFIKELAKNALNYNKTNNLSDNGFLLAGYKNGLFSSDFKNEHFKNIWNEGSVEKIIKTDYGYFFLTSKGIVFSEDLKIFKYLNIGIGSRKIKTYQNKTVGFTNELFDLKDLEFDINNSSNLITCSTHGVYYSTDKALSWNYLKTPSYFSGIKAVCIFSNPDIQIMMSHPFMGIYYKNITKNTDWKKINEGIKKTGSFIDEISDITIKKNQDNLEIYCSENFNQNIYKLDMTKFIWEKKYSLNNDFDLIESLYFKDKDIFFMTRKGLYNYNLDTALLYKNDITNIIKYSELFNENDMRSIFFVRDNKQELIINELWLIGNNIEYDKNKKLGLNKKGLYLNVEMLQTKEQIDYYSSLIKKLDYNMCIVDMKDDFGSLRFAPDGEYLKNYKFSNRPVNLKDFAASMKANNIHLVARIVLFKDKKLYNYNNNELALRDSKTKKPWQPYDKLADGTLRYRDEFWVDPFSEKVWEYNIEITKELIAKGFDEIQFDYIRFPTDGDNVKEYYCANQPEGMDKESALISFLKYARENINAPISIDIYGANGWYRSGCVTGQNIETFHKYIDIICPMYYPSHFESNFMNQDPAELRPYRIYYYGSLRNYYILKKESIVRPWLQAFRLNVAYDNKYFNDTYIANEIKGCADSINHGFAFWNPSAKYQYLNFLIKNK